MTSVVISERPCSIMNVEPKKITPPSLQKEPLMLLNQTSKRLLNQLNKRLFTQPSQQLFKQPNKRLLPQSHNRVRALLLALMTLSATLTWAQPAYPDKTVRMVVPYPPSGGADILARAISQKLTAAWGQSVVIPSFS